MLTVGTVVCDETGSSDKWTVLGFLGKGTCCEVYKVQSQTKPYMKVSTLNHLTHALSIYFFTFLYVCVCVKSNMAQNIKN